MVKRIVLPPRETETVFNVRGSTKVTHRPGGL